MICELYVWRVCRSRFLKRRGRPSRSTCCGRWQPWRFGWPTSTASGGRLDPARSVTSTSARTSPRARRWPSSSSRSRASTRSCFTSRNCTRSWAAAWASPASARSPWRATTMSWCWTCSVLPSRICSTSATGTLPHTLDDGALRLPRAATPWARGRRWGGAPSPLADRLWPPRACKELRARPFLVKR